jgi:catechol 2,3-dioxygenase-like lactoylglutathione lyase family enzyme
MANKVVLEGVALHVKNLDASVEFYSHLPGATILFHIEGRIAIIQIGPSRINLVPYGDDIDFRNQKFHLEIETADLNATYRELQDAGFTPTSPPTLKPWGETDFHILDPDGYVLEVGEPNPVLTELKKRVPG